MNMKSEILIILLLIIISIGSFLRLYNLKVVFTEYDDVGVVSVHKGHVGVHQFNILVNEMDLSGSINMESIDFIERTFMFPLYIAYSWTYAPGQYLFYPLILSDQDEYSDILFKGRLVSAIFSIFALFIQCFNLYLIDNKKLQWSTIVLMLIPIFSMNTILYAHHMSPYSAYMFSTSLGLLLLYLYNLNYIKLRSLVVCFSLMLYFSYLVVLFAIPILLLYVFKKKNISLHELKGDLISVCIGLIISFPAIIMMKRAARDTISHDIIYNNFSDNFIGYSNELYRSINSIIYGIIRVDYLILLLIIFMLVSVFFNYKSNPYRNIYFISVSLIFIQWILLQFFKIIPLEATRHMLIILPVIIVLFHFLLKDIINSNNQFLTMIAVVLSIFSATSYAIPLIDSKATNFDYKFISKFEEDTILLYRSTLGPLSYFSSSKSVYNIDMNSFVNNHEKIIFPDKMLLISQHSKINDESLLSNYKSLMPEIFCKYTIEIIREVDSNTYFTYDNSPSSSLKNGMFIYRLVKSSNHNC
mgnify:CR=1 FL=1